MFKSSFFTVISLSVIIAIHAITVEDVYKRLLERERGAQDTFAAQFIRPVGSVGGELIWPRSYSKPSYLVFDENGAAFNVRPSRPSLREILSKTPVGSANYNDNDLYDST
uniref:Secreted protein n=1 Tax=Panagrellus redivivus TaxID=6233 RepID=A0A7E4VYM6_PANRE